MRSRWMIGLCAALAAAGSAQAETGVTDHEIKIGQTIAYSGNFGRAELASVKMINGRGGMRGRKINLISLDDGYLPPRGPEQTRRLVEQDKVFIVFAPLGTASNVVLGKYLKEKHVPQVFAIIGVASFGDHARYPWTTGWQPTYEIEDQIFTRYILKERPNAKIAILYQNDELGKDYVRGIQRELGDRAKSMIVGMQSYEITDPSVESQVVTRHHSGADTFINVSTPKFAAQSIRKAYDIVWQPLQLLSYASAAVTAVMVPAGAEKGVDVISSTYFKDPTDPRWADDPDYRGYTAFIETYLPGADKSDIFYTVGYMMAASLVALLDQSGDDLTRENVMREVAYLDQRIPMPLPGIKLETSPTNYYPIRALQLERFDGKSFVLLGEPVTGLSNPQ